MTEPGIPTDVPDDERAEGEAGSPLQPVGDREANEADVIEQELDVPLDDDDVVS